MIILRGACLLLSLSTIACVSTATTDWPQWIVGDWVANDGAITEHWQVLTNDTMEGYGVSRSGSKTSTEFLRLVRMGADIFFIAKVAHNEYPVAFKLSGESNATRLIFTNPSHDFPRRITYEATGPGQLLVVVSDGADNGFSIEYQKQ